MFAYKFIIERDTETETQRQRDRETERDRESDPSDSCILRQRSHHIETS